MQTIVIQTPRDLEMILRVVKANLKDQTIVQQSAHLANVMPPITVASLNETGSWPDVLAEHFLCSSCAQRFRLEAETYHGAGGRWTPS